MSTHFDAEAEEVNDEFNLDNELSQKTNMDELVKDAEIVNEVVNQDVKTVNQNEKTVNHQKTSEEPKKDDSPHIEQSETSTDTPEGGKPKLSPLESADALVGALDFIQRMALTWVYRLKMKKRFSDDQKVKIVQGQEAMSGGEQFKELDPETQRCLVKWDILQDRIKNLAVTEKEFDKLKKPIALYCQKYNKQVGPEMGLIVAAVDILGSRIADALID